MLKLVIHSPKGGVGKTTIATNITLILASQGKKVLALDLAQGSMMSSYLEGKRKEQPEKYSAIEIRTEELGELPTQIKGARNYDVMVADTDDYYEILNNLVDPKRRGWRALAPIVPDDAIGLNRIAKELGVVASKQVIASKKFPLKILPNRCGMTNDIPTDLTIIQNVLEEVGILSLMSQNYLPNAHSSNPPIFIEEDRDFCQKIENVLSEIGVG